MRITLIVFGVLLGILVIGLLVLLGVAILRGDVGRPLRYDLPAGYRGWVVIQYEDPSCPPLKTQGIYLVIPIPSSGRGCTASPMPKGWRYYRYEYVSPEGTRTVLPTTRHGRGGMIWARHYVLPYKNVRFPREDFFVGTEEELKKNWATEPSLSDR